MGYNVFFILCIFSHQPRKGRGGTKTVVFTRCRYQSPVIPSASLCHVTTECAACICHYIAGFYTGFWPKFKSRNMIIQIDFDSHRRFCQLSLFSCRLSLWKEHCFTAIEHLLCAVQIHQSFVRLHHLIGHRHYT